MQLLDGCTVTASDNINTNMDNNNGMSYDELIIQLKSMRAQIDHHRQLTKELHLLDTQYWYISAQDRNGSLPEIGLTNAHTGDITEG